MMFDKNAGKHNIENVTISNNNLIHGVQVDLNLETEHVGEMIFNTLSNNPNHVAQIDADTGKETTFSKMKDSSVKCAVWLEKQGIGFGDIVAICTYNRHDSYIPVFATFYLGAIHNPWRHNLNLKAACGLINKYKPKIIFACEEMIDVLYEAVKIEKSDMKIIVFGNHPGFQSLSEIINSSCMEEEAQTFQPKKLENPAATEAYIGLSSGTTGVPKGIVHSYKSVVINSILFGCFPADKIALFYADPNWVTWIGFTLQLVFFEGTRIIHGKFEPDETCRVIEKYKVHSLYLSATAITRLCKFKVLRKYKMDSLRFIMTSGAKVYGMIFEELKKCIPQATIIQGYGMTEQGRCVIEQTEKQKCIDSIGFVGPNVHAKIVDISTGRALEADQRGELCIKTANLMLGYFKDLDNTRRAIDEDGWLHTGDTAYFTENGEICIVGRIQEVIKYRDTRISPFEIEDVLITHPDVLEVYVVPVPHEVDGERPMAFVVKVEESQVSEKELENVCAANLGENKKLPGGVIFLRELPSMDKIVRQEFKQLAKALNP